MTWPSMSWLGIMRTWRGVQARHRPIAAGDVVIVAPQTPHEPPTLLAGNVVGERGYSKRSAPNGSTRSPD
jgi:hypothetical protein